MLDIKYTEDGHLLWVDRDATGIPCQCGGYAESVNCTEDECEQFGCGWDRPGRECCARAFVCRVCGKRITGQAAAPEME